MDNIEYYNKLINLREKKNPFVSVILVDTLGSTPQDEGSKMLVTESGIYYGTVGGGKIETRAIEEAIKLINQGHDKKNTMFVQWSLNKDIGMTCGGSVRLYFELFNQNKWEITIFGAGHVSNSLIPILLGLDCNITCIDPRKEWLDKLPESPKLTKKIAKNMPSEVKNIKEDSFVCLITMGHTTDKPILLEILKTREFPYIGVIGSKAKRKKLEENVEEAGLPKECNEKYYCPFGLKIGSNHTNEIAISIAAQLIEERDKLFFLTKPTK